MLDPMRPGVCAAILSAAKLESAGYVPEYGLDTHFLARARKDGKTLSSSRRWISRSACSPA